MREEAIVQETSPRLSSPYISSPGLSSSLGGEASLLRERGLSPPRGTYRLLDFHADPLSSIIPPPSSRTTPSSSPACPSGHAPHASTIRCTSSPGINTYAQSLPLSAAAAAVCAPRPSREWLPMAKARACEDGSAWEWPTRARCNNTLQHTAARAARGPGRRVWSLTSSLRRHARGPRELDDPPRPPHPHVCLGPRYRGSHAGSLHPNDFLQQRQRQFWRVQSAAPRPVWAPACCCRRCGRVCHHLPHPTTTGCPPSSRPGCVNYRKLP